MMPDDDQVWSNKLLLRHADVLQKAKSFLPPASAEQDSNESQNKAVSVEEPWPEAEDELAGLGAVPQNSKDETHKDRRLLITNDKLRRQLLNRDALKLTNKGRNGRTAGNFQDPKPKPRPDLQHKRRRSSESNDDDEGRSKLGSRIVSSNKSGSGLMLSPSSIKEMDVPSAERPLKVTQKSKNKRPLSYLDQVLADRQRKRKNK